MPLLVHISDLHFGPRHVDSLAAAILTEIQSIHPDLLVISGDWTMRGRIVEYKLAQSYLAKLPRPLLTIPGNHDQPLHPRGLFERLIRPWSRYQTYIHRDTDSSIASVPGLFVVGLNDNHQIIPGGVWWPEQRKWLTREFASAPQGACKILVTHHHLLWQGKLRPAGMWYPSQTLSWLAQVGVELVLNGHTHTPLIQRTPQGPIVAQAGTAMSGRTRLGHGNGYNLIRVTPAEIVITLRRHDEPSGSFLSLEDYSFPRTHDFANAPA